MSTNPTFTELRESMPIAEFFRLESMLKDPETKVYKRQVIDVRRKKAGEGVVGLVKYAPIKGGKFDDPGEIKTAWLDDAIAFKVCSLAKSFKGRYCVFFQRNIDKSEEQPTGFRELCWIQVVEDPK